MLFSSNMADLKALWRKHLPEPEKLLMRKLRTILLMVMRNGLMSRRTNIVIVRFQNTCTIRRPDSRFSRIWNLNSGKLAGFSLMTTARQLAWKRRRQAPDRRLSEEEQGLQAGTVRLLDWQALRKAHRLLRLAKAPKQRMVIPVLRSVTTVWPKSTVLLQLAKAPIQTITRKLL